jgi:1-acyl-sn-glycerol-3-phosphate acyltransferase
MFRAFFRLYFRYRYYHTDRIPEQGAAILASNHASFADPPLVGCPLARRIDFLARKTLFRFPIFGACLHKVGAVPVDRDGGNPAGLKAILDRLEQGRAVLLFPEGTRSRDGQLQTARAGVGLIAIRSGAPVFPVRIFGSFEAYGRHQGLPRPRRVQVVYGPEVPLAELRQEAAQCEREPLKKLYQEAADEILRAIARIELPA